MRLPSSQYSITKNLCSIMAQTEMGRSFKISLKMEKALSQCLPCMLKSKHTAEGGCACLGWRPAVPHRPSRPFSRPRSPSSRLHPHPQGLKRTLRFCSSRPPPTPVPVRLSPLLLCFPIFFLPSFSPLSSSSHQGITMTNI